MIVNIDFTLDIDATGWLGAAANMNDAVVAERVSAEVRGHAETVIRDLFHDQGWTNGHE